MMQNFKGYFILLKYFPEENYFRFAEVAIFPNLGVKNIRESDGKLIGQLFAAK